MSPAIPPPSSVMIRCQRPSTCLRVNDADSRIQELGSMYDYLAKIILLGPSGCGKYGACSVPRTCAEGLSSPDLAFYTASSRMNVSAHVQLSYGYVTDHSRACSQLPNHRRGVFQQDSQSRDWRKAKKNQATALGHSRH